MNSTKPESESAFVAVQPDEPAADSAVTPSMPELLIELGHLMQRHDLSVRQYVSINHGWLSVHVDSMAQVEAWVSVMGLREPRGSLTLESRRFQYVASGRWLGLSVDVAVYHDIPTDDEIAAQSRVAQ